MAGGQVEVDLAYSQGRGLRVSLQCNGSHWNKEDSPTKESCTNGLTFPSGPVFWVTYWHVDVET